MDKHKISILINVLMYLFEYFYDSFQGTGSTSDGTTTAKRWIGNVRKEEVVA